MDNILDKNYNELKRHCTFNHEEQYDFIAGWILGSFFLRHAPGMKVASFFPMLGFISPEADSGKSTSVKVVSALSYDALPRGKRTGPSILRILDRGKKRTFALDELDKVFAHGKDNEMLISIFNLGYEWDAVIGRCVANSDKEIETNVYCPKVFGALSIAKFPPDTKSRCWFVPMRPWMHGDKEILLDIDYTRLGELNKENLNWSESEDVIKKLTAIDVTDVDFLTNRNLQLWRLPLAIAKLNSDGWYKRMLAAAKLYTRNQSNKNGLYRKILIATRRICLADKNDRMHSIDIVARLHEFGIPEWVDQDYISTVYNDYDEDIRSRQTKIDGINRNGYYWYMFEDAWSMYKIDEEINKVDGVEQVGAIGIGFTSVNASNR